MLLVEAGERVLAAFPPKLSAKARRSRWAASASRRWSTTWSPTSTPTASIDRRRAQVRAGDRHLGRGRARRRASRRKLAEASGAETDRVGRLLVEPDLTLPGHPEVLAIGDMVQVARRRPAARASRRWRCRWGATRRKLVTRPAARARTSGRSSTRTRATWPRSAGRGRSPNCRRGIRVSGFLAWALWLGIHLFYLVGFQNRLLVFIRWGFSFLTHGRGTRLITGEQNMP